MYLLGGFFSYGLDSSITYFCFYDLFFIEPVPLYFGILSTEDEFYLLSANDLLGDLWYRELLSGASVLLYRVVDTVGAPTFFLMSCYLGFMMLCP